jgi:hypothetical protein
MKILILADHWAVASGRYCKDALKRMGHEVLSVGKPRGTGIWGVEVDEKYVWQPDDLKREKPWTPDLILVMDGTTQPINRAEFYPKALWAVYGVDNHVLDYKQWNVDHLFLAHGHGHRMGEDNVTWLPCGYDPAFDMPGGTWDERQLDAALVGVLYGQRGSLLYALREAVPAIKMAYDVGPVYDGFANVYGNTRVSLVLSAADDVAQRVWETAALGCLVVKDANPDDEALGLEHLKNCLIYDTLEDAVALVRWSMAHPDEAQKIARAGKRWAKPSTWDKRLETIIAWTEAQRKPKRDE